MQNVSDLNARLEAADKKIQLLQSEIKESNVEDLVSENEILKVCATTYKLFSQTENFQHGNLKQNFF